MDALVKALVPQEEGLQESHILKERGICCLADIRKVGEPLGISCQQLFERAYARAGIGGTHARAIFASYLSLSGKGPVPVAVKRYIELVQEKDYEARSGKDGFCVGCMLDRGGIYGFIAAYDLIEPVDLKHESRVLPESTGHLSTIDALYMDLIDSGALDKESETWEDVLDTNFDPSEEG